MSHTLPVSLREELNTSFKSVAPQYADDELLGSLYNIYLLYEILPFSDPDTAYNRFQDPKDNPVIEKSRDVWVPPKIYSRLTANENALLYRKMDLKLTVRAAVMEVTDKKKCTDTAGEPKVKETRLSVIFPGVREEKVEQALLKLAIDGQGFYREDGRLGVRFTLGDVQRVLKLGKSTLSKAEIKEAILILGRSEFTVTARHQGDDRRIELARRGYRLNDITEVSIEDYKNARKTKEEALHSVVFHELIAASMKDNALRVSNFASHCQLNKPIARQIHSELRLEYTYAGRDRGAYRLSLFRTFSSMGRQSRGTSEDLKDMRKALEELHKAGIIRAFDKTQHQHKVKNTQGKSIDYEFDVYGSDAFVSEMILANAVKKKNDEKVLDFTEFKNRQSENSLSLQDRKMMRLLNEHFTLAEQKIKSLIEEYSHLRLQSALDYTLTRARYNQLSNPSAYFLSVLENDYDASNTSKALSEGSSMDQDLRIREEMFARLSSDEQAFVNAHWHRWKANEKEHVNRYGLTVVHMREAFFAWKAEQHSSIA
jgi:hypothetical protein